MYGAGTIERQPLHLAVHIEKDSRREEVVGFFRYNVFQWLQPSHQSLKAKT